jgi:GNAT superfamily N-acetyltransferase
VTDRVRVRPASLSDHEAVARLYVQLKRHHQELQSFSPRYSLDDERWDEVAGAALEDPDVFMHVAEIGGRVVGFMKITYAEKPWGVSCELETMVVDEKERGRGVGTRMLEKAEILAREHGAKGIRINVLIPNYGGRGFYERAGYEAFAVRYGKPLRD